MAVAFDASSISSFISGGAGSWTHTPVGTPKAVLVLIVTSNGGGTDPGWTVTYGGVSIPQLVGSPVLKLTGERSNIGAFFLGSGIPTGAKTVAVVDNPVYECYAVCYTLTAGANTKIQDIGTSINSDSIVNPSEILSLSSTTSWCAIVFGSGQGSTANITPLSNWTSVFEQLVGAGGNKRTFGFYRYNTVSTADVTAGWTQTAEDAVAISVAISEIGPVSYTLPISAISYAETLQSVGVKWGHVAQVSAQTYTLTVNELGLTHTGVYELPIGAQSYALTLQDLAYKRTYVHAIATIGYGLTINDIAFAKTDAPVPDTPISGTFTVKTAANRVKVKTQTNTVRVH